MSRRWCIITGPRSGSTWFEYMIGKKIKSIDSRVEILGEIIDPWVNLKITIDQIGNLKSEGSNLTDFKSISELIDERCNLFLNSRDDQPLMMRIFPKNEIYNDLKFQSFINLLKEKNFNFVSLNRNIFDRCISLYFMYETNIIHRFNDTHIVRKEKEFKFEKEMPHLDIVKVDAEKLKNILLSEFITDKNIKELTSTLGCYVVDYENIIEDCQKFNIPIDTDVIIKKTYDVEYQNIIENYQELLEIYKEFEIGNVKT